MPKLTGSEEIVKNVEEVVETPVYTGIAAKVNAEIEALTDARAIAVELESGLDTQAAIKRSSVLLREKLLASKSNVHAAYKEVIPVREGLLGGIEVVQKANAKASLEAQIAEMQAKLAGIEA